MVSSSRQLGSAGRAILVVLLVVATGCREDPVLEPDDMETPTSVTAIQTPHDDAAAPALGSMVFLRSVVVTAFDTAPETTARREQHASGEYYCVEETGYTGAMVVQDMEGGQYSGVPLFNPTLVPAHLVLGPGDLVDVHGQYVEFCLNEDSQADSYCDAPNSNRLTQLTGATVTKVGETAAPEPIEIPAAALRDAAQAEPYEGTLVRVVARMDVVPCAATDTSGRPNCCVGSYDRYGNLELDAGFTLTNEYYTVPSSVTCVDSVTGVVTWFGNSTDWGEYSISPRGPNDVEVPPGCLSE